MLNIILEEKQNKTKKFKIYFAGDTGYGPHFSAIKEKFAKIGIIDENNVVFSCGSGITASVLGLAYSMINDKYLPSVYDGSWVEYGKIK